MFRSSPESQLSLSALQDEMGRLVERVWHAGLYTRPFDGQPWAPTIDMHELPDRYLLYADMPGVEAGSVELSFVNEQLTIRGEKLRPGEAERSVRSLRNERRFGAFCRTIEVPGDIEADKMTARCRAGVLIVTLPKTEASRAREIKVEVEVEEGDAPAGAGSSPKK